MNLLNILNKNAMIAMMIAATGLPASMASAQFKIEHSVKSESAPEAKTEHRVMIIQSDDDEHTYEVKIVNGEISVAQLDGKDINKNKVKIDGQVVIFIGEDGKTIHELKLPELHQLHEYKENKHNKLVWKSAERGGVVHSGDHEFVIDIAGDHEMIQADFVFEKSDFIEPKVMLGINLGEPSSILRKHLRLKDGMHAILVEKVIKGLPAALGGVQDFDVIISIDGSDDASGQLLGKILSEKDAGDSMKLVLIRGGEKVKVRVKLVEYNAEAFGTPIVGKTFRINPAGENEFKFELLTKLEEGEFGNLNAEHLTRLKEELHKHLGNANENREIAIEMRGKAMAAMKDAERQILEFRDGKLLVRTMDNLNRSGIDITGALQGLHEQFPGMNPEALHEHMGGMEDRLAELEDRLNSQMDQMSVQMDRLANMFERLMDRLENAND